MGERTAGVELVTLGVRLGARVVGLSAGLEDSVSRRWAASSESESESGWLELEVTSGAVGLASGPLVEARVEWRGANRARVETVGARAELVLEAGRVRGSGALDPRHARGGLESLFRTVTVLVLEQRNVMVLHASAVRRGDQAVVVLGESGAGKTTTARRLGREGMRRMADDLVAVAAGSELEPMRVHELPFERAGRVPRSGRTERAQGDSPQLLGALIVSKNALRAGVTPVTAAERVRRYAEALVALPCPPGAEGARLERFLRLGSTALGQLEAPRTGPLAGAVGAWLDGLAR